MIKPSRNLLIPFVVFALISGIFLSLSYGLLEVKKTYDERDRLARAQELQRRLNLRFESYLGAAMVIRERLMSYGELTEARLEEESLFIRSHFHHFQAINYVAPDGIIRWVTPVKSNEGALGKNLFEHPIVAPMLQKKEQRGEIMMSPPLELLQGGHGIVFYIPLKEQGWLNIVVKIDPFIGHLFSQDETSKFRVHLKDESSEIVLFSNLIDEPTLKKFTYSFDFFDRPWRMTIQREDKSLVEPFVYLSALLVLVLSLLLAVALKKYLDHWDRVRSNLKEAMSEAVLLRALGHDLNTPLTVCSLLVDRLADSEDQQSRQIAGQLRSTIERQSEMLKGVRELQLLKYREASLELTEVIDVPSVLRNLPKHFYELLKSKELDLMVEIEPNRGLEIQGLRTCFEQHILSNLVSNGIKYSPKGGKLIVRAFQVKDDVLVEVEDQGAGIPSLVLDKIAQDGLPDSSLGTSKEVGSGFGLLLVKNFVELLNGEIIFRNLEQGARIQLRFKAINPLG